MPNASAGMDALGLDDSGTVCVSYGMFPDAWLQHFALGTKRGLVFAAGGGADIILARFVAERVLCAGCAAVDLAQPLNRCSIGSKLVEDFQLTPRAEGEDSQVLCHAKVIANTHEPRTLRGKGICISAAIPWDHGLRLVFAAQGEGCSMLAHRAQVSGSHYDFAIAVDGGGDILTAGQEEFDRVVLQRFRAAWSPFRPLMLFVIGLGADGASRPVDFGSVSLDGMLLRGEATVDEESAKNIEGILRIANRWHQDPLSWNGQPEEWAHGLHVPQIVVLATRKELPMASSGSSNVLVPRRPKRLDIPTENRGSPVLPWLVLDQDLLRTARCYSVTTCK